MKLTDMVLLAMYEEDLKTPERVRCPINSEQLCVHSEKFTRVIEQLSDNKYIKNLRMRKWSRGIPDFTVLYNWEMTELGKEYVRTKLKKTS